MKYLSSYSHLVLAIARLALTSRNRQVSLTHLAGHRSRLVSVFAPR